MHLKALGEWPESSQGDVEELAWPLLEKFVLLMLGKGPEGAEKAAEVAESPIDLSQVYPNIKMLIKKLIAKSKKANALLDLILADRPGSNESTLPKIRIAKFTIKHCGFSSSDEQEQKEEFRRLVDYFLPLADTDLEFPVGKLFYYMCLRLTHKSTEGCAIEADSLVLKMWIKKAYILRGHQKNGFQVLQADLEQLQAEPALVNQYSQLFGKIICRKPSPTVCKENGFTNISKMYAQRLFTLAYPRV